MRARSRRRFRTCFRIPIKRCDPWANNSSEPLDVEMASTLLYEYCSYSYRQIRRGVAALSDAQRKEIIDSGIRHRGRHDEMVRAFRAGQQFRFDILMDIGGFRDMHRHRRCIQIGQDFTFAHGYDTPTEVSDAKVAARYGTAMERVRGVADKIVAEVGEPQDVNYLIPLAYRK